MRRKQPQQIINNSSFLDRDSGIVTETESDAEYNNRPNYIFSDDDDNTNVNQPMSLTTMSTAPLGSNSAFNSPSYYSSLADQSVISIRQLLKDDNWKKVLKHKSGTTVYMLQQTQKNEKIAFFRGESIIQGFTPQSIFYVIGMRKLWDEQFDEGNLIENLNDTTSLTYESYKSTATSKAFDMTLVEKIECSSDGEILFACTSIDTPKVPKTPGKNRHQIKLQGWILKQLNTIPVSTKVTYITQENIKGWIPGLTKKSLARKPLIIASIDNYLKKKADRLRLQQQQQQQQQPASNKKIPNTKNNDSSTSLLSHSNTSLPQTNTTRLSPIILQPPPSHNNIYNNQPSPTLGLSSSNSLLLDANNLSNDKLSMNGSNKKLNTIILSNPPPRISSLRTGSTVSSTTRHITFADDAALHSTSRSPSPMSSSGNSSSSPSSSARSSFSPPPLTEEEKESLFHSNNDSPALTQQRQNHQLSPIHELPSPFSDRKLIKNHTATVAVAGSKLYPASRHRGARKQCMEMLQTYAGSDLSEWKQIGEKNRTKLYSQAVQGSTLPIMRSDTTFFGSWTPEQICSVIQCFGARKIWDEYFEDGYVVERFSQKEYLIYTQMKSVFPIQSRDFSILTCIESNVSTGVIYVASTSVEDILIPETTEHTRGSFTAYGWALHPLKSVEGRLMGVKATFIAHMHMGGVTPLPSAIIRLLTTQVPACADRIQTYLRQHGCPPYIRRVAGKITHEHFDSKEKVYSIHFIAKHAPSTRQCRNKSASQKMIGSMWCTDLRTHLSMYPFGYVIETNPASVVRVEMRPDGMGIRIYTEKSEMDGKTVELKIRQNQDCPPGGKPQFSWNGVVLLNVNDQQQQQEVRADLNSVSVEKQEDKKKKRMSTIVTGHDSELSMANQDNHMNTTAVEGANYKEQRRDSHVIVISEDLAFTAQQFAFVALLMAVCYYFGKFSCKCSI